MRLRCRLDRVESLPALFAAEQDLLEEHALAHDAMDASRVFRIREEMERAEARRLQPHYIKSFFLEAFKGLGGAVLQREVRRFEVTHVPAAGVVSSNRGPATILICSSRNCCRLSSLLAKAPAAAGPSH